MNQVIKNMYVLFLKWRFPLITYKGEVYFTNRGTKDKKLTLDRIGDPDTIKFLNKYGLVDKEKERERYKNAEIIQVNGQIIN